MEVALSVNGFFWKYYQVPDGQNHIDMIVHSGRDLSSAPPSPRYDKFVRFNIRQVVGAAPYFIGDFCSGEITYIGDLNDESVSISDGNLIYDEAIGGRTEEEITIYPPSYNINIREEEIDIKEELIEAIKINKKTFWELLDI
jgi:hypothetical protein